MSEDKVCPNCKERKLLYAFYGAFTKGKIHSWCKECEGNSNKRKVRQNLYYYNRSTTPENRAKDKILRDNLWERYRVRAAKARAKKRNLPFNITEDYIKSIAPSDMICPALGIQMKVGEDFKSSRIRSPSLDRLVPELGYVKGNVIIVSTKANVLKRDATPEELMKVARFYAKVFKEQNPRQLALDL